MNTEQIKALLKEMYELSKGYSDRGIKEHEFEHYVARLDNTNNMEELQKVIKEILYELNVMPSKTARKIAYPCQFNKEVINWKDEKIKIANGKQQYYCSACECYHDVETTDSGMALSIDHEPSLSERFNDGEWLLSREERCASYNNIETLQIMCQRENSKKGGQKYNKEKIFEVFIREIQYYV